MDPGFFSCGSQITQACLNVTFKTYWRDPAWFTFNFRWFTRRFFILYHRGTFWTPPRPSETWSVFTLAHLPVSDEASRSVLSYVYPSVKAPLCGRRRGKRTLLTEDVTEIESFLVLFFFQAEGRAELRNMLCWGVGATAVPATTVFTRRLLCRARVQTPTTAATSDVLEVRKTRQHGWRDLKYNNS